MEALGEHFCALGAENVDDFLALKDLSKAQAPMGFLRSLPLIFHYDTERRGALGFKQFCAAILAFRKREAQLLDEYRRNKERTDKLSLTGTPPYKSHCFHEDDGISLEGGSCINAQHDLTSERLNMPRKVTTFLNNTARIFMALCEAKG